MRISDWSSDVCSSDLLRSKRDVAIFGKKLVERRSLEAFAIARPKSGVGGQNPDAARRKQGLSTEPAVIIVPHTPCKSESCQRFDTQLAIDACDFGGAPRERRNRRGE